MRQTLSSSKLMLLLMILLLLKLMVLTLTLELEPVPEPELMPKQILERTTKITLLVALMKPAEIVAVVTVLAPKSKLKLMH